MARPYIGGTNAAIVDVTASVTLQASDHGKTFMLDGSGVEDAVLAVTLPAVSNKGMELKFVLKAIGNEAAEDIEIVQAAATEDFVGHIVDGAGSKDTATGSDTKIIFDQSGGAAAGDWVKLISDGTNWYVSGLCGTAGDVVFG
tara:strand:+ start:236 stop:664 length:429 start_codon:yes stop_codon:yes gene_type:complete